MGLDSPGCTGSLHITSVDIYVAPHQERDCLTMGHRLLLNFTQV